MKRLFDLTIAFIGLILFALPLLGLTFLVRYKLGSPVFFCQVRTGIHGELFTIVKFRSMTKECSADGVLKSDAERLTSFGRFLRSTSLDELPELWNVIKGDMSIVGPRPLLVEYLPLYSSEQARRLEVRPGLTGWAQVNGRNALGWQEKFALDVWYVEHQSMWVDIKIIALTIYRVLLHHGISAPGEATMPRFIGNKNTEEKNL